MLYINFNKLTSIIIFPSNCKSLFRFKSQSKINVDISGKTGHQEIRRHQHFCGFPDSSVVSKPDGKTIYWKDGNVLEQIV